MTCNLNIKNQIYLIQDSLNSALTIFIFLTISIGIIGIGLTSPGDIESKAMKKRKKKD